MSMYQHGFLNYKYSQKLTEYITDSKPQKIHRSRKKISTIQELENFVPNEMYSTEMQTKLERQLFFGENHGFNIKIVDEPKEK